MKFCSRAFLATFSHTMFGEPVGKPGLKIIGSERSTNLPTRFKNTISFTQSFMYIMFKVMIETESKYIFERVIIIGEVYYISYFNL